MGHVDLFAPQDPEAHGADTFWRVGVDRQDPAHYFLREGDETVFVRPDDPAAVRRPPEAWMPTLAHALLHIAWLEAQTDE